jgi:hypothetical protein
MSSPDFYLRFVEGFHDEDPRPCFLIKQIAIGERADNVLVKITPPCLGRNYELNFSEIDFLVLGPKYQDGSVTPVNKWPLTVYVWAPTIARAELRDQLDPNEVKKVAFGEVYIDGTIRCQSVSIHSINPW